MKMKKEVCRAYMDTAQNFAQCSTAKRLKVGAIIVDPSTGAIVSVGYNGMPAGLSNVCERKVDGEAKTKEEVLHAEENAICKMSRSGSSSEGTWMFVTHSPCVKCARLIAASGIARVFYSEQFKGHQGCGLDLLSKCGVKTIYVKPYPEDTACRRTK